MTNMTYLIKNQIKRVGKDNLLLLLSVYPLILAVTGRYLVPFLRTSFIDRLDLAVHYPTILAFLILANPYIYGALAAFLLLDEREENVLQAIRVTPLSLNRYLLIKVAFFTGLSFVSGVFITLIAGFLKMSLVDAIALNALLALAAPFNMVLINSFAKNRVEGFALVKGSGMLIMLPLAAFYIPNPYNVLVGILPGYWPAMAIRLLYEDSFSMMPYWSYAIAGLVYMVLLIMLLSRRFKKNIS